MYQELPQVHGGIEGSAVEPHIRQGVTLSVLVPPPPDRPQIQFHLPYGNVAAFPHRLARVAFHNNLLSLSKPRSERPYVMAFMSKD